MGVRGEQAAWQRMYEHGPTLLGTIPRPQAGLWALEAWIRFTGRTPTARDRLPLAAQQLAVFSEVHQRVLGV